MTYPVEAERRGNGLELIEVPVRKPTFMRALIGPPPSMIRRFADEGLQASIDKVLAGLPSDRKAVELEIGFDQKGVQVVGVFHTRDGWTVLGGVSYDKGGNYGGTIGVRKEW